MCVKSSRSLKIMNVKTVLSMAVTPALIAALAQAPVAVATPFTNTSGTICKNYNAADASYIDYLTTGTRSYRAYSTAVICPLSRDTINSNGAYAYVDVTHSTNATTSCTLYSYSYLGTYLGSVSQSWTGSGAHEIALGLTGAGKSNTYSDYAVLCYLPGNSVGTIMGVDLSEY